MLLRGYDEEDADVARKALNSPFVKHMDVEYSKYLFQHIYAYIYQNEN